jgi:hypothetical protein
VSDRSVVKSLTLESPTQISMHSVDALNSGIAIEYMTQTYSSRISGVDMLVAKSRWYGFRDYPRRCKYLAKRYEQGSLGSVPLRSYRSGVLWKMLAYLSYEHTTLINEDAWKAIKDLLSSYLMCRRRNVKIRKEIPEYILKLNWTSKILQRIPLKRILLGAEVNKLLPRPL